MFEKNIIVKNSKRLKIIIVNKIVYRVVTVNYGENKKNNMSYLITIIINT